MEVLETSSSSSVAVVKVPHPSRPVQVVLPQPSPPIEIGGGRFVVIAGPCSIENEGQLLEVAQSVQRHGAGLLRGGVWKLRTHPNSFQGLGAQALDFIPRVLHTTGLGLVTEVTDPRQIEILHDQVSMFQVGARNMYNYPLLKELGKSRKPILLKRGFSALLKEWTQAALYIEREGNSQIVLCERGIRTFETSSRFTMDLNSVVYAKLHTPFPVIVDPSHASGRRDLVIPLSCAAAAAGADGLIVEVHNHPKEALSDGDQALTLDDFRILTKKVKKIVTVMGRDM